MQKRIGIIVDNPRRDLSGAVLIAKSLIQKNLSPVLIPMYDQWRDLPNLNLSAVLLNYARVSNIELIKVCKAHGIKVFIHDTEGGVFGVKGGNSPENIAKHFDQIEGHKYVDRYFFWGQNLRDEYLKHTQLPEEKAVVTGSARHDVCYGKGSHPKGKFILINSNFPIANSRFLKQESEKKVLIEHGWTAQQAQNIIDSTMELQKNFVMEVQKLAQLLPEEKFIFRNHPFEDSQFYANEFKNFNNVEVTAKGEVFDVIKDSIAVVHAACGTSIDAVLFGKVPISLKYLLNEATENLNPMSVKASFRANNIEEVRDYIERLKQSYEFPFNEIFSETIEPWFYKNDGAASLRISDEISRFMSESTDPIKPLSKFGIFKRNSGKQRLINSLAVIFGSNLIDSSIRLIKPKKKIKYFSTSDVKNCLKKLDDSSKKETEIQVSHCNSTISHLPLSSIKFKINTPANPV